MQKYSIISYTTAISILIIALSIAYYLVIFIPEKEKAKQDQINKELQIKETEQGAKRREQGVYADCDIEANDKATELLKSKIEIATKSGGYLPGGWKEAAEK